MQQGLSLLVCSILVLFAAGSGGLYMPGPWYDALNKPWWTPPDWVFPVAWTILYTMIAAAGWFAWKAGGFGPAMLVWLVGLVLNGLWSYFMFGRQDIFSALIDVSGLWLTTAGFMLLAWPLDKRAVLLFAPYLVWVTFAALLNLAVWRMN
jgi:translocator protein